MLTLLRSALIVCLLLGSTSAVLAQEVEGTAETAEVGGGDKPISAGLLLGYGISFEDGPNIWGFGLGLRGGYNLGPIFLGARFVYYFGEDNFNLWELGIEGGYDLPVGPVIIRPGIGLGIATVSYEIDVGFGGEDFSDSETNPYLALGSSVLCDITEQFFVGGDLRFQFVFGDAGDGTALIILANGGMRF